MWSSWDCYLTAYRDVLGLVLPEHERYRAWEACSIEGGFRIVHEEFCIVSDRPEVLLKDEQNRPHCETGPSHRWRDGWELYFLHGVEVPKEWVTDKESMDPWMILNWPNTEQRRVGCEHIGWNKIIEILKPTIVDQDVDPEIGTLLEVELPDSGKERFLKVRCGTGRDGIVLPVPPDVKTALEASAWTYGLENDVLNYIPEVRT
ncbi:MAG TPA: hypothetical protein VIY48_00405 [Candidatus Paceibacterota bacterium]